jgi:hypothetical protein
MIDFAFVFVSSVSLTDVFLGFFCDIRVEMLPEQQQTIFP